MALVDSVTGLATTAADMLQARLALFSLDVEDGVRRIVVAFGAVLIACLLIVFSSLAAAFAFVLNYWPSNPVWALTVVAITYLVISCALIACMAGWLSRSPTFMHGTISSLGQDKQVLRNQP